MISVFTIQINFQIPDGCSQTTVCKSLREQIENCFDTESTETHRVPLFQVYFYGLGTYLWKLDAKLDNELLFQTNGCATRFARRSSKHSKKHCHILIITVSAYGFLREATTTENGWKSPMTPSHFRMAAPPLWINCVLLLPLSVYICLTSRKLPRNLLRFAAGLVLSCWYIVHDKSSAGTRGASGRRRTATPRFFGASLRSSRALGPGGGRTSAAWGIVVAGGPVGQARFWVGRSRCSLHSSCSVRVVQVARAFVSGHPRPGPSRAQRGRLATPWRAAGRRIRVASTWRERSTNLAASQLAFPIQF